MNNLFVIRGGSWFAKPDYVRSVYRNWSNSDNADFYLGFRLAFATYSACRAVRGGAWGSLQANVHAAARGRDYVGNRFNGIGFRLTFD